MLRSTLSAFAITLALAGAAHANSCSDAIKALQATYAAGSTDEIMSALAAVRQGGLCTESAEVQAMRQVSGVLAARAGRFMAQDKLAEAEALLELAPALHWAVQAVRADIAAKRGNREEAAALYNAALDTITDPALTPPNPALIPHAERLAQLAQENMMLAGTLDSTITRGGDPSGVLKSAVRGIAIESVGEDYADGGDVYEDDKKEVYDEVKKDDYDGGGYAEAPKDGYADAPKDDYKEEKKDDYAGGNDYVEPPKKAKDPYAGGKKDDYAVADEVAKKTKTVFLPIRFAFDSDKLDPKGVYEAQSVGAFLIANGIKHITLVGHTDEKGAAEYNLDLSFRRAAAVRDYLIQYGVKTYIQIDGKGEYQPPKLVDPYIYSNEERRAIARRVELVLQG
ncbi:OmpA family protein [Primorskyibacter aestuariivivens]|uniref:OmpA family protein n=1 Tax=Primorskyibacter aestuariivivens TaxID=1888912 RepID=UPI0023014CE3|nr:OmpA family protein [Primorskyibacter aestuariivivens]MDA7428208.1 OmpA family protein [Primorskyibacter aestuariivivens]